MLPSVQSAALLSLHLRSQALGVGVLAWLTACQAQIGAPLDPLGTVPGAPPPGQATAPDGGVGPGEAFVAFTSEARRLSRAEIENTLRDLVGEDSGAPVRILAEDQFTPYDNDYRLQAASQALIDSLEVLAEDVAARVLADPAKRAAIIPCAPTGAGDAACFRRVIEQLGKRAFRRPLTEEEITGYLTLQSYATESNPYVATTFDTAVNLLIRSFLQDPELLYRIEIGAPSATPGVRTLSPYEIASRMSYLLWGSLPDDALFAGAEAGSLATPEGRRAAAERMLQSPAAKSQLHRFHAMWLGYRAIPHPADLTGAFNRETTALIDRVVFDDRRSYLDLFRLDETYVDDFLADYYGFPRPSGGAGWVRYDPTSKRAGILSHGSVLAAFSKFTDTSPTQRGILIRTRLMCQTIQPPPVTVNADQPPGEGTSACKKDRYLAHVASPSCASCHNQMDPIGFGLENFDIGGRWRDHDEGKPECTIDGAGALPSGEPFSGPAELAQKLIDAEVLESCAVHQYLTFAVGRPLDPASERGEVDRALASWRASGSQLDQLILDQVASPAFGLKKEGN